MSSPLVAVLTQIADDWTALTPPDRPEVAYHEVENQTAFEGVSGVRGFIWSIPTRNPLESQAGEDGGSQTTWDCEAKIRLTKAGRGRRALIDAIVNEGNLLARAIEKRSAWPAGALEVSNVFVTGAQSETGVPTLTITFTVYTAETD